MEIRVLKYFLAAAREESITKAAEVLHITQPTLSRQLKELEEETGVKLFERGAKKISLTNEGILLRRRAEEIVSLVDKTERELMEQEELVDGRISIGCGILASSRLLADIIKGFSEKYPLVKYDVFTANADMVKERMNRGLTDVGLMLEPVEIERFEFIRLDIKEKWVLLTAPDSPVAGREYVTAEDLSKIPLIFPGRQNVQNEVVNWFGGRFEGLNIICADNFAASSFDMVKNGLGSLVTLDGGAPYLDEREIYKIPLKPELYFTSVIAWRRRQPFSLAVTKFIEYIKETLRD
ncbi:MAG: LysR family transcriptional regulator [Clostridiales bacterium]|nr:LysR family transcriptional regulator [Clostridiales bacterium]